jgi:hypothetical protein
MVAAAVIHAAVEPATTDGRDDVIALPIRLSKTPQAQFDIEGGARACQLCGGAEVRTGEEATETSKPLAGGVNNAGIDPTSGKLPCDAIWQSRHPSAAGFEESDAVTPPP